MGWCEDMTVHTLGAGLEARRVGYSRASDTGSSMALGELRRCPETVRIEFVRRVTFPWQNASSQEKQGGYAALTFSSDVTVDQNNSPWNPFRKMMMTLASFGEARAASCKDFADHVLLPL